MTTATKGRKPRVFYTPAQREIIRAIKQAICEAYAITEDDLLNIDSCDAARLRYYCFWILAEKANMKDAAIADTFSRARSTVQYGIEQIAGQKDVYRNMAAEIKAIQEAANKYPKKFEWCIL